MKDGGFKIKNKNYHIVVVGTGGTGSDVAIKVARLAFSLIDIELKNVEITLVDNDTVEHSNLYRQHFAPSDVGENKAELIAKRYGNSLGINIHYVKSRIDSPDELKSILFKFHNYLPILVGCVDNNATRRLMSKVFESVHEMIWLDSGNELTSGQVCMGVKIRNITVLPPVTHLFPNILDASLDPVTKESCSNVRVSRVSKDFRKSGQYFITNVTAATIIVNFLFLILLEMDITVHAADFNTSNIHVKPRYISDYMRKTS